MAYITGSVFDSLGILPFSLAAGTQLTMSIQNNSNAPSYYGLETIPNNNGFYTSATPKNTSGSYISGSGISYITYDDYKMVAVVNPGGGTLVYTPSVAVSASTVWTKGTGASLLPADFGTLLPSSYNLRVVNSGGYVESPDSITAAIAATPILKDASFLYIPSGYSSGTAFSELSTNDYGDLTWSRASDGTRTNSEGLVQRVPWNLLSWSEDFSNAVWTKTRCSTIANSTTAPNGTTTADTLVEDTTATSTHPVSQAITFTASAQTFSIYAKAANRNWIQLNLLSTANASAYFNLSNGTVGTVGSAATASIESVGDGWYRCIITVTTAAGSNTLGIYPASADATTSFTGNGTASIYIWGAQIVEGTSPQSYLPTTTRLNVPRLDYTYGTSPASLMEPQRTNLALYSQQFDDAYWGKTNVTISANATTSPDGTSNADTFAGNGVSGSHYLSIPSFFATTSGVSYTISIFAKKNTNNFLQIDVSGAAFSSAYGNFDLNSGVVGSIGGGVNATITSVGNGWYRCTITKISNSTGIAPLYLALITASNSPTFETNTLSTSLYLWGAQVEAGAYPSTYIPTTSTTVTRIADSFTRGNIYTNGMITSAGGTWYTELRNNIIYTRDANTRFGIGDTSILTSNSIFLFPSSNGRLLVIKAISGSTTTLYTTTTDTVKIAIKWDGTSADIFANGTKVVSATSFTTTNMENLVGNVGTPVFIQAMALYNQPIAGVDMGVLTGASYYPSFLNMAQANNYTIA